MSAERTGAWLLRAYPRAWRQRYGSELENLIVEASDGGRVGWRTGLDVLAAGGRERLRAIRGSSPASPGERVTGSLVLVLWAWALLVVGGLILQRFSEHWQTTTPASVRTLPSLAFGSLAVGAACGAVLVVAAIAVALPSLVAYLRSGGWRKIRLHAVVAASLSVLATVALAGLIGWASGLDSHQREGGDPAYAVTFVACCLLACACLAAWTATAAAIARRLELQAPLVRLEAWLSAGVALAIAATTAAALVWWVALASAGHSFLAGSAMGGAGSALPLVVAVALMLGATFLSAAASLRAVRALPQVSEAKH